MMVGEAVLDTNIIVGFLEGDTRIVNSLDLFAGDLFVPATVLGELKYGAYSSVQIEPNLKRIDDFLARCQLIEVDSLISSTYGKIKSDLRKSGNMVPDNDIWIAAATIQHECTLITRDYHFQKIVSLRIHEW